VSTPRRNGDGVTLAEPTPVALARAAVRFIHSLAYFRWLDGISSRTSVISLIVKSFSRALAAFAIRDSICASPAWKPASDGIFAPNSITRMGQSTVVMRVPSKSRFGEGLTDLIYVTTAAALQVQRVNLIVESPRAAPRPTIVARLAPCPEWLDSRSLAGMDRLEELMRESEECALELADALRRHADEDTIRALQMRVESSDRAWKEEAARVKEEAARVKEETAPMKEHPAGA